MTVLLKRPAFALACASASALAWLAVLLLALLISLPARALAAAPDAEALMNWAESTYPDWFPGPQSTLTHEAWRYRSYRSGNLLGVNGDGVYVLGPLVGSTVTPVQVGTLADFACQVTPAACAVSTLRKPLGMHASAPGSTIYTHAELHGVLVRVFWSQLEAQPGQFDFAALDKLLTPVRAAGKPWSLGVVAGGPGTPAWLIDQLGAAQMAYTFRGTQPYRLPLFWDAVAQTRLTQLAQALAQRYGDDSGLQLVYVPQMTANGIEGHLNGIDMAAFKRAGYTDDRWVEAATATARAFATALAGKPLAFEVHEIDGSVSVPQRILQSLRDHPDTTGRVGAAVWWLSGRTDYQASLLKVLGDWGTAGGDLYGQAIARADSASQFGQQDYATMFAQAKSLRMRYIEAWEYDFGTGNNTANGRWNTLLADFNSWATQQFGTATRMAGKAATQAAGNPPPPRDRLSRRSAPTPGPAAPAR